MRLETSHPGYGAAGGGWCLIDAGGEAVAWAGSTVRGGDSVDCALTVLPGPHAKDAARVLLRRLTDRIAQLERDRGTALTVTFGGVLAGDETAAETLAEAGFVPAPGHTVWEIDLTSEPVPARLPENGLVRPLAADDLPDLHRIHMRRRGESVRTLDSAVFSARVDTVRVAAERGTAVALVLEVAGRTVGYVLARGGVEAQLIDTAVAPAARGLGVGLALVVSALAELRRQGCGRATLSLGMSDQMEVNTLGSLLDATRGSAVLRFVKPPV
ncbi:GNAT family N-acetyltransferase [Streptomyces sp. NPDC052196]|uniref:GNAT family N-acetyltransferase n=1 Tax=Streptomyces sp. NPDC052196 TaxID=3156691 RepID=UPI0034213B86